MPKEIMQEGLCLLLAPSFGRLPQVDMSDSQ